MLIFNFARRHAISQGNFPLPLTPVPVFLWPFSLSLFVMNSLTVCFSLLPISSLLKTHIHA